MEDRCDGMALAMVCKEWEDLAWQQILSFSNQYPKNVSLLDCCNGSFKIYLQNCKNLNKFIRGDETNILMKSMAQFTSLYLVLAICQTDLV